MLDETLKEYYSYIQSEEVKEAFLYLIEHSKTLQSYRCRPAPHGYINRNYHYFFNDMSRFAFVVTRKWLLFYVQRNGYSDSKTSFSHLKEMFSTIKLRKDGEINFRIFNKDDAILATNYLF